MQHSVRMKFCSWHLRYYFVVDKFFGFFLRLNKLLVESVWLRRLSCLESMSKETVMSQNYIQPHKDVEVYRSATFYPIKLWKPFCLYEYFRKFIPGLQWTLFLVWWISCFVWDFDITFCWVYINMNSNMLCMMWWPVMTLILPTLPEWCDVITFLCFWGHHVLYVILWKIL